MKMIVYDRWYNQCTIQMNGSDLGGSGTYAQHFVHRTSCRSVLKRCTGEEVLEMTTWR